MKVNIRRLRFKSIQTNMIASFLVLIVFLITIIGLVSYRLSGDAVEANAREYTSQIIQQVNSNIEYYINSMNNISETAFLDYTITDYLAKTDFANDAEKKLDESKIIKQFNSILNSRKDIASIMIFGSDGKFVTNRNKILNPSVNPKEQDWYKKAVAAQGAAVISSSHVQNILDDEHKWVVSLSRQLFSRDQLKDPLGIFLVDLNYSVITDICNKVILGDKGYVFIVDALGNIVYHPQQQLIYSQLKPEMIDQVLKIDHGSFTTHEKSDSRMYTVTSYKETGWKIVGVSYINELVKNKQETQTYFILGGLGCFIVAILISILISRQISKPIKRLERSMKEVEKGNFNTQVAIESFNEIGKLSKAFNKMTTEIKELMEQNIQVQELKRKSELQALQAQINPHFLYNTLDSIIWMAEGKMYSDVIQMTSSLAKLLRISISQGDETIPLKAEIEHIESYLNIQKIRYGDRLDFTIEVEAAIMQCKVLKVLLQPLVENAIYHGIKNKLGAGMIHIIGKRVDEQIVLQVKDNGVGMTPEQLESIFKRKTTPSKRGGIGVANVDDRIKLYFGKYYGIRFESEIEVGTTVYITLPLTDMREDSFAKANRLGGLQ